MSIEPNATYLPNATNVTYLSQKNETVMHGEYVFVRGFILNIKLSNVA